MDNKKIFIIGGVLVALGVGYYFWNKSKNANGGTEGGTEGGAEVTTKAPADSTATKGAESSTDETTSTTTKAPLTKRKDKRKACGRKPINKQKRAEWQKCVDAGGKASFEGDFDEWQNDYMDFEGLNLDL
jgi:hypothetical protein